MPNKVIILGAGYAGVEAALTLYKGKKANKDIQITLIDKNSYHTLLTELHEVAGNRIDEEGVIVPLRDIFKYTDVKIVKDEIQSFDFENNMLISAENKYDYDYLIIASGSQPNFYGIPGMEENCFTLWSYNDALKIREQIINAFTKASQEKDLNRRKSLLTFVVGGGGFTGVEMVGELAQWVKSLCKEYEINREEVKVMLIEALPNILHILKPNNISKVMKYLKEKLNVEVRTDCAITKVTSHSVELKCGTVIPTDTLIWTAGIKASEIGQNICELEERGCRIKVDNYTSTKFKNVFAVGDVAAFSSDGYTLPALVETALQTGKTAAKNTINEINGNKKHKLRPKLHGVMVSVGSFFAVTDLKGIQLPRPFAVLIKYMVNIHYLFGIGGFELVIKYIKHEVFNKQQKRFLVEDHYSVITQAFWLVPIRLFLGYSWLKEGVMKIDEGWLLKPILAGLAVDGNSGASATETGEKVFRIVSEHTPNWYAWIAENIIVPNALLFQILIVLTEVALGLAFISGTFTFIAGIGALALNINFILSTGLYDYNWWYIPAAICMLGGAGKAFGVDYYLIPYLMRQWRYFVRNKKIKPWLFH